MDKTQFNDIHFFELETLSPVHVGSGGRLKKDFEYLEFPGTGSNAPLAAVMDLEKVFHLLRPENLNQWLQVIERNESTFNLLKRFHPKLQPADISSRTVPLEFGKRSMREFREMIFNGDGLPYIPGSSLKGVFRTALLAEGLRKKGKMKDDLTIPGERMWDKWKLKLNKFFGEDMNSDVLRFLAPSDATFAQTECVAIDLLNRFSDDWDWKKERDPLFLETLKVGEKAFTRIVFPKVLAHELTKYQNHGIIVSNIPTWQFLLQTLHAHSLRLLREELAFWAAESPPPFVLKYVDYLQSILEKAQELDPTKEALLRVGFATGWKNITGAWQEHCMTGLDFQRLMDKFHNTPFAYPKTRKIALGKEALGYMCIRHVAADKRFVPKTAHSEVPKPEKPPIVDVPAEKPIEPKYHPGPIHQGVEVDAEYAPQPSDQGVMKTFRLFLLEPGKEQMVQLRYPADLPAGQRVKVRITDLDRLTGRIKSITFSGKL
jgi:CRISPR-associated protein Csm5